MAGQGYSLHVGLNTVDKTKYTARYSALKNAENDAIAYKDIAEGNNFKTQLLIGKEATSKKMIGYLDKYSQAMTQNDILFLTYSGHGTRVKDRLDEEPDGYDEILVLYDRLFIDDEFGNCWSKFPAGSRVLFINDSCLNGTASRVLQDNETLYNDILEGELMRGIDRSIAEIDFSKNETEFLSLKNNANRSGGKIECSIIHIAACQDNQLASDGSSVMNNGFFTHTLLELYDNGSFTGSYKNFYQKLKTSMPPYQTPNWDTSAGIRNEKFENEKIFIV